MSYATVVSYLRNGRVIAFAIGLLALVLNHYVNLGFSNATMQDFIGIVMTAIGGSYFAEGSAHIASAVATKSATPVANPAPSAPTGVSANG